MLRTVGIVGAGTVGLEVGHGLACGRVPRMTLLGFLVRSSMMGLPAPYFSSVDELLAAGPSVVVEAASHQAVRELGESVLSAGADLVCLSTGALGEERLRRRLLRASARYGGRLIVPSGAVAGLDALVAASYSGGLAEVTVEQRKPPASLLGRGEACHLETPRVVFDGSAGEVVTRFPRTTNVAASVALAGVGFDATRVIVIADPSVTGNQVVVRASGSFGVLRMTLENTPSSNPRTSAIVAQSVIAALCRLGGGLAIPG